VTEKLETLLVERRPDGVILVTLNRPERRNAVSRRMHDELVDVLRALRREPDVGAVVLTGAGGGFCAGGDVDLLDAIAADDWRRTVRTLEEAITLVREFLALRAPLVAAVNGAATGLGATIALLADIVVMADNARIGDTHVNMGIVAGDGGTVLWPALVGPARAKEYLMTGELLDAATAERIGLVNHVVPAAELMDRALGLAAGLAAGPRMAIAFTKAAVNAALDREVAMAMPLSVAHEARTFAQPDLAEGTAAFRERRPPRWPSTLPETAHDPTP